MHLLSLEEAVLKVIRDNKELTGDCIRVLAKVYEYPKDVSYNLKQMAEELGVERRSVRRHVDQLLAIGVVTYNSGRIRPVNIIMMLSNR